MQLDGNGSIVPSKTIPLRIAKDIVFGVLDSIGIAKRTDEGDHITYFFGDSSYTIRIRISFHIEGMIVMYSWPEFQIPEKTRPKALEYLNRRNFSSKYGALELDMDTGDVRYRTSVKHNGARSIDGILTTLITMHQGYFARVIYPKLLKLRDPNDETPVEALVAT